MTIDGKAVKSGDVTDDIRKNGLKYKLNGNEKTAVVEVVDEIGNTIKQSKNLVVTPSASETE